jgi:hypothetical protein
LFHQDGNLFELNVKLGCPKVNYNLDENYFNVSCVSIYVYMEGGRSKLLYCRRRKIQNTYKMCFFGGEGERAVSGR